MKPCNCKIKSITKSNRKLHKSILPTLDKVKAASTPGLNIMLDDNNILTVIDKQYFGRTFFVKDEDIYTVKLGVFHDTDKGALEEAAIFCAMPIKAACEQQVTAVFDIPKASARFMDAVSLKATRPFSMMLIEGSPILERHNKQWGIPLKYGNIKIDDIMILLISESRKNVPTPYRIYFDILRIQIKLVFK